MAGAEHLIRARFAIRFKKASSNLEIWARFRISLPPMPEFNEPRLAGWVSSFRDSLEDGAEKIFFDGPKKPPEGP